MSIVSATVVLPSSFSCIDCYLIKPPRLRNNLASAYLHVIIVRDRFTEPASIAAVPHDDATRPAPVIYHEHLRQDDQPEDGEERYDNQEAHARTLPRSP